MWPIVVHQREWTGKGKRRRGRKEEEERGEKKRKEETERKKQLRESTRGGEPLTVN